MKIRDYVTNFPTIIISSTAVYDDSWSRKLLHNNVLLISFQVKLSWVIRAPCNILCSCLTQDRTSINPETSLSPSLGLCLFGDDWDKTWKTSLLLTLLDELHVMGECSRESENWRAGKVWQLGYGIWKKKEKATVEKDGRCLKKLILEALHVWNLEQVRQETAE